MDVQGAQPAQPMSRVVFRADASVQMGTGHIMRCLSLADALSEQGAQCSFVCREHPGHLIELIRRRGFAVHALPFQAMPMQHAPEPPHADWLGADWQRDAQETAEALGGQAVDWLVLDHYALDRRWELALRPQARRMLVIDDLADRSHDCDVLLDQNWFGDLTSQRYRDLVPARCQCLLGPTYALLKPEYALLRQQRKEADGRVSRVLVFFGGSDPSNETAKALQALTHPDFAELAVDVVLGPNHPDVQGVVGGAARRPCTTVHQALPSLAPLMLQADLMLGAGGSTTWERMCLGLPAIVVSVAANQTPINQALMRDGYIQFLGEMSQVSAEDMAHALRWCQHHPDVLKRQSRLGQALVTGLGASTIGQLMLHTKG